MAKAACYAGGLGSGNGRGQLGAGAGSCETDSAYLERVIGQYGKGLYALCHGIVGDCAEDALQETWISAYRKRGTFRGKNKEGVPCSEYTWLHGIARNCALSMMRRMKTRRKEVEITETEEGYDPRRAQHPCTPDEVYRQSQLREAFRAALRKLGSENSGLILSHAEEAYREKTCALAQKLNASDSAAKCFMYRLKGRFYRYLQEEAETHGVSLEEMAIPSNRTLTAERKKAITEALAKNNGNIKSTTREMGCDFYIVRECGLAAGIEMKRVKKLDEPEVRKFWMP